MMKNLLIVSFLLAAIFVVVDSRSESVDDGIEVRVRRNSLHELQNKKSHGRPWKTMASVQKSGDRKGVCHVWYGPYDDLEEAQAAATRYTGGPSKIERSPHREERYDNYWICHINGQRHKTVRENNFECVRNSGDHRDYDVNPHFDYYARFDLWTMSHTCS